MERGGGKRERSCMCWFIFQMTAQLGLVQAEARSWELDLGLSWVQGPKDLGSLLLSQTIIKELDQKRIISGAAGIQTSEMLALWEMILPTVLHQPL